MSNTDMRNRFKSTLIAAAIAVLPAVLPLASHAAGLGKITVLSALGQPLKAELEVTATSEEAVSLAVRIASVDAFRQAGIDYSPALATLRFSREIKERGGRRFLEISTDSPLNEPFIDMLVELNWASGRLVREYTFLMDPPDLARPAAAPQVAAPEVGIPASAAKETAPGVAEPRPVIESRPPVALPPATGSSHTVVKGDTLSKIAAQAIPDGVSLDQMLVALFRSNKDAFIGDNMNRLKAGKILSIPGAEAVKGVSPGDARKEVVAQSSDFNAYRQRLAAIAATGKPVGEEGARQAVSGKIAPKVDDKAPMAVGKDKLEVSSTETSKDAKGQPSKGSAKVREEDLVARERALKEASSRAAELEKNVSDLKKLAELKSQAGADLQKGAQAAKPVPVEAAKADVPAAAPKPAEPPSPAGAAIPAKPGDATIPVEAPKPPPPKKKVVPPPPPPPEPDFLEENGPLVFGGGALLVLLLGWLGLSAYRKKRAAVAAETVAAIAETDLSTNSVFSTTTTTIAAPPSEQESSQFSTTIMGAAASGVETVDPVVEADTFLAFGRDAQAEEILLEAIKADPERQAIHTKLLEIYANRKSAAEFESIAKVLHNLTGGAGEVWEKVAAMGIALDPKSSLYASAASAEPVAPDAVSSFAATIGGGGAAEQETVQQAAAPAVAKAPNVDFDLDIGTAVTTAPAAAPESAGLDFDLDLGAAPTADAAAVAEFDPDKTALDIDFDMPGKDAVPVVPDIPLAAEEPAAVPKTPAEDSAGIDFDFDLGTPEPAVAMPAGPVALDLGGISLDLDAPVGPVTVPATDMPDNPEVATKLELALAYEEMGDKDGARELFQEALAEGSPAQQKVARAKLDGLG